MYCGTLPLGVLLIHLKGGWNNSFPTLRSFNKTKPPTEHETFSKGSFLISALISIQKDAIVHRQGFALFLQVNCGTCSNIDIAQGDHAV